MLIEVEVNRGGYISIIQRTEVNVFRYFRLCGDLLCKWNSCMVLQFITLCEDKNIAKIMLKGDILFLTRNNAGSVSAWDQKQFAKLLSFLWFALNISRWTFHCFCWQAKQLTVGEQFSLRPRGINQSPNRINPRGSILYHSLKPKCFYTVVLGAWMNILFQLQLRYYARVTWGEPQLNFVWRRHIIDTHVWSLKKSEMFSLGFLVRSPAVETKQRSSSSKRRIFRDHGFFQRFFLKIW